ncbi:hypothetical protein AMTRI_Chr12g267900 [Amborella trichopoda]
MISTEAYDNKTDAASVLVNKIKIIKKEKFLVLLQEHQKMVLIHFTKNFLYGCGTPKNSKLYSNMLPWINFGLELQRIFECLRSTVLSNGLPIFDFGAAKS